MKIRLKKCFLLISLLAALLVSLCVAACSGKPKYDYIEVDGEYGYEYDLHSLPELGDVRFYDLEITSPNGTVITPNTPFLYLNELGEYTVVSSVKGWKIKVKDTLCPVVFLRGSLNGIFVGDTVTLPKILVRDNGGNVIDEFTSSVYYGDTLVSEERSFVVENEGTYTLKIFATDQVGNFLNYNKNFEVRSLADSVVVAGTEIALDKSFFGNTVTADKEYELSFAVRVNGTLLSETPSKLVVAEKSVNEIVACATEKGSENTIEKYAIVYSDDIYGETCNRRTNIVEYGITATNGTASFAVGGNNTELKIVPTAREVQLGIPVRSGDKTALENSKVKLSFDLRVEGYEEFDFGTDANRYTTIIGTARCEGDVFRVRGSVEGIVRNGKIDTVAYVRAVGNPFYLDNFVYESLDDQLPVTVEEDVVVVDKNVQVELSDELFGVQFTDFMGVPVRAVLSKVTKTVLGETTEVLPPYHINTSESCFYDVEFRAEGGTPGRVSVKLAVGDADVYAPVLTFADGKGVNQSVKAGTEITLSAEGLGLVVEDEGETKIAYTVRKNGADFSVTEGKFTVGSGEYYEIQIKVCDESLNESTQYVLIRAEDCYLVTFDDFPLGQAPSSNYVCNQTDNGMSTNNSRTVVDLGAGNLAFCFTPGHSQLNLNWVADGIPAGKYDIKINFRFDVGAQMRLFLTDATYQTPINQQDINGEGITEGSITISDVQLSSANGRYGFRLFAGVQGNIYVESIQFIVK